MEDFNFSEIEKTEKEETNLFQELQKLIETSEAVLTEVPVWGGEILDSVKEIVKRSGLPESDQRSLLSMVEETLTKYDNLYC